MKTFLSIALCLSLAPAVLAQTAPAGVHDELRRVRDDVLAAINKGDVDGVLKHLHPNVVFTPMNGEVCRGPAQVRAYFDKMMKGPDRIVESVRLDLKVDALTDLYGDTGIAYGSSNDHYKLANGLDFPVKTRWTCSLVRENGRWLITAFQASPNAFDNPILLQKSRAAAFRGAGIGGVIGMIVGLILAIPLRRRMKK